MPSELRAGQRQQTQEGATTTKFLYDGAKIVLERDGSNNTLARYTHEGGSLTEELISMRRSGSSYYYLMDGLGSVRQVLDSSQATQDRLLWCRCFT